MEARRMLRLRHGSPPMQPELIADALPEFPTPKLPGGFPAADVERGQRKQNNALLILVTPRMTPSETDQVSFERRRLVRQTEVPCRVDRHRQRDLVLMRADTLRALQNVVMAIAALRNRKSKNDRQQKQNTQSWDQIREAVKQRDSHMESYELAHQAMIWLNAPSKFPPLTEADLYMKSVQQKRRVGDSKLTNGLLFRTAANSNAVASTSGDEPRSHRNSTALIAVGFLIVLSKFGSGKRFEPEPD
ncbi:hypothetical protein B0H10DRAFT_1966856 [Mycena sp. CBHHK59/15]|nr:hypothetical protein B0H10DRAFT_1966856 [Mycena sp. CBHHK59/15]